MHGVFTIFIHAEEIFFVCLKRRKLLFYPQVVFFFFLRRGSLRDKKKSAFGFKSNIFASGFFWDCIIFLLRLLGFVVTDFHVRKSS